MSTENQSQAPAELAEAVLPSKDLIPEAVLERMRALIEQHCPGTPIQLFMRIPGKRVGFGFKSPDLSWLLKLAVLMPAEIEDYPIYYSHTPVPRTAEELFGIQEKDRDPNAYRSREEIADTVSRRVFVTIGGASFPSQHDAAGPYIPLKEPCPPGDGVPAVWIRNLPTLPEEPKPLWPFRMPTMRVSMQGAVGTIDELVELYRLQLTRAAVMLTESKVLPYADHEAALRNAAVHGYKPGQASVFDSVSLGDPKTKEYLDRSTACYRAIQAQHAGAVPPLWEAEQVAFAPCLRNIDVADPIDVSLEGVLVEKTEHGVRGTIHRMVLPHDKAAKFLAHYSDVTAAPLISLRTKTELRLCDKFVLTVIGPQMVSGDKVIVEDLQFTATGCFAPL